MTKYLITIIILVSFLQVNCCQAAGVPAKKKTTKKATITTSFKLGKIGNIHFKF